RGDDVDVVTMLVDGGDCELDKMTRWRRWCGVVAEVGGRRSPERRRKL
ncbi:hypothetical protein Tco_1373272, partial [Tanacetum coccineum]